MVTPKDFIDRINSCKKNFSLHAEIQLHSLEEVFFSRRSFKYEVVRVADIRVPVILLALPSRANFSGSVLYDIF